MQLGPPSSGFIFAWRRTRARLSDTQAGRRDTFAFLDTLAWAKGAGSSPATIMDGYDVIVTGIDAKPEVFKDFSPVSQDLLEVLAGRIETAIKKCRGILPSAGNGQRKHWLED